MIFGIIGIFKFKSFYTRILVTALIDTVGTIAVIFGLAVMHGFSFFSLKLLLLIIFKLMVNPLASHIVARSAYLSGYEIKDHYSTRHRDIV
jgi:multicomponent Na+:H+ antiporter subunit G